MTWLRRWSTRSPRSRRRTTTFSRVCSPRFASELVWADDGERRYQLSDDALAMARRIGDQHTIANVLLLRNMTIASPDTLAQRVAECDELLGIAEELHDPALVFQAAFHRSGTAMEAGNVEGANAMVELAGRLAKELNQPGLLFHTSMMQTSRRIFEGALADAEQGAFTTLELGQHANQGGEAAIFFSELSLEIRRWQGRLREMLPEFADLAGVDGIDFSFPLVRYLYDAGEEDRRSRCATRDHGTAAAPRADAICLRARRSATSAISRLERVTWCTHPRSTTRSRRSQVRSPTRRLRSP